MRKILTTIAAAAMSLPAFAAYDVAGDFNGWNAAGNAMTETFAGSGIWQVGLTGLSTGRHEFKITDGTWSNNWPDTGNSWLFTDGSGNVTITFDANTYTDGWNGSWGRMGLSTDPGTWTAAGDWQGWNNADGATAMTSIGGGVYEYQQVLAPGSYQYKAVVTGSWDAIGDNFRCVNANTTAFTLATSTLVTFEVNALNGSEIVMVPEPSNLVLLCGGLVAAFFGLRRRQ